MIRCTDCFLLNIRIRFKAFFIFLGIKVVGADSFDDFCISIRLNQHTIKVKMDMCRLNITLSTVVYKNYLLSLLTMILVSTNSVTAQDDYHIIKVEKFQREAEYYHKKAEDYRRGAEYYLKKIKYYQRLIEYYTKKADWERVKIYSRYANQALYKYKTQLRYAQQANEKTVMYLRWAAKALNK